MKPATPFARAVNALQPGAGGRSIVKLLDGKAKRFSALDWRAGRRQAPKWALDILAGKIQARIDELEAIVAETRAQKERLGLSAGALNLRKYHASKNR